MGEFFKPWQRKIGIVTLMMACVFTGLWVRGQAIKDVYQFGNGNGPVFDTVVSSHYGLMWFRYEAIDGSGYSWNPGWFAIPIDACSKLYSSECRIVYDVKWHWGELGFDFCDSGIGDQIHAVHRNIPYWSIVLPLTANSAFLLLSKPRVTTQKKTDQPTANAVA